MPLDFAVLTPASALRVAGITPFTTIDYPGKLSAVVFLRGCPWRCSYCHNRWMRSRRSQPDDPTWDDVARLLDKREGLLDAVVFSGGEPCMDPALPAALRLVKERGFAVGLHTSGAYPRHLKGCVGQLDWIGLDVKGNPQKPESFDSIAGIKGARDAFLASFDVIKKAGLPIEARTTVHPKYISEADILAIGRWLSERGVKTYALQIFRKAPGMETDLDPVPESWPEQDTLKALEDMFDSFILRRD